jgi:hypothetical protein
MAYRRDPKAEILDPKVTAFPFNQKPGFPASLFPAFPFRRFDGSTVQRLS